jgi:hypothetical protein
MKLLRDPLLHFAIAGGLLFGGYALVDRDAPKATADPIRIGEGEVRWLRGTFANQWQRRPNAIELRSLVDGLIEEQLLAREAEALGLDRDDTIVRRRLAQKLSFLIDDTARIAEPSDEALRSFHATHPDLFRTQGRISFTQLFFNPERRPDAETDAKAALASLSAPSGDPRAVGDPTLLESQFRDVDEPSVATAFGPGFARAIFSLPPGPWSGPVTSGYGIHLVRVTELAPTKLRPFEEVRAKVAEEWRRRQEAETKAAYLARLRTKYGVVLDDAVSFLGAEPAGTKPE